MRVSNIPKFTSEPSGPAGVFVVLRRRIRAPLHQIVSYAEIISEGATISEESDFSTCLRKILEVCESVLRETNLFPSDAQHASGSVETLQGQLFEQSQEILTLCERLQAIVVRLHNAPIREDTGNLRLAAQAFADTVRAIGPTMAEALRQPPESSPAIERPVVGPGHSNGHVLNGNRKEKPALSAVI